MSSTSKPMNIPQSSDRSTFSLASSGCCGSTDEIAGAGCCGVAQGAIPEQPLACCGAPATDGTTAEQTGECCGASAAVTQSGCCNE
ncbi:hypothetical protein [Tengunoibacter tsumagoiensis]|uniref:hypothetical protein n=1 Tax=Tengunoibacter tsumagoiensis TaxID=2014871 RepID=UPI000F84612C|nr:hypothetical protein [Tengunoibacter tsumagoiensis]